MLMPSHHWANSFAVTADDIEFLAGLLLEGEKPLTTDELTRALVERRLAQESDGLKARFRDARVYDPALTYQVGQKLVFPTMDFRLATVKGIRPGDNPQYGPFNVIDVAFEDGEQSGEFAADYPLPHKLSVAGDEPTLYPGETGLSVDDILADPEDRTNLGDLLYDRLIGSTDLVSVAGRWFPRDLILDVNEGHLHLADAVLDIAEGGPLDAESILEQIGGLGNAPKELQIFSLNYALSRDSRFDEVGPAGQILWYLARSEPEEVRLTPEMLRYTDVEYDRGLLTQDMLSLEAEIDDELSPIKEAGPMRDVITITLNYPHRRTGTLPLNAKMRRIFPTARRTSHIWVTLVDGQDNEEFQGWVVRKERYVYGLMPFYKKHKLPIGAYIAVHHDEATGKIVIDFRAHRPRTEWIRLITPKNGQISFENQKRSIGAEYDDLMIVGADDLTAADALFLPPDRDRRNFLTLLRILMSELSRLNPQGTVHFKTLYSALNVMRRCPPGPIFSALLSEPDFEHVGNHYWKLSNQ